MSELARGFGISDVGLAKRCRSVDVPIPYRGYWARVAAGQTPQKLPLPKYRTRIPPVSVTNPATRKEVVRDGPEPEVRFGQPSTRPDLPQSPDLVADEVFRERIAGLKIMPNTTVADTNAAVRRTAKARKFAGRIGLRVKSDEAIGPIVDIDVNKASLERSLLVADQLIRTAEGLGWTLEAPPPQPEPTPVHRSRWDPPAPVTESKPAIALLNVDGEPVRFRVEERIKREPREPTRTELAREKREHFYQASRTQEVPTGSLRVVRLESSDFWWGPKRKTWFDRSRNPVEDQIPSILYGFHEYAVEVREKRAEREREVQRQAEIERLKQERQERRAAHAKLRATLERQAGAWFRARLFRRYVRAARRKLSNGQSIQAKFRDQPIDFLNWASNYIEQLDPLSTHSLEPEQWPEPSSYPSPDESALKRLLCRVTGFDGLATEKPFIPTTRTHDDI
jgi:hypothetical protein